VHHISPQRTLFRNYRQVTRNPIGTAGKEKLHAQGQGDIDGLIWTAKGLLRMTFCDVLYVPEATESILSVERMEEQGVETYVGLGRRRLHYEGITIPVERTSEKEYKIRMIVGKEAEDKEKQQQIANGGKALRLFGGNRTNTVQEEQQPRNKQNPVEPQSRRKRRPEMDAKLLHARLGHLSDVRTTAQQQGIRLVGKLGACSVCERGKASARPVKKYREERTTQRLELVHTDIAGPVDPSFEGSRYVIIFVDDYSRMRKIYTLRHKSEALSALQRFEKDIAKASGLRIQRLRSDQGGEFTGDDFRTYCSENGIKQEFSAAYSPQQNGIAERSWRTLFDMARCKMITANLGRRFWAEAAHAAEYCLNRAPTRALEGLTPYE